VLGLLLASLGIYGVVAVGVSQRRREIGIRIALGADRGAVIRLAVRDGLRLIGVGLGVGLLLAVGGALVARGLLFGLAPLDPIAFLVAPALFLVVTLAASWLPARRAAGVDPMVAFRAD
jgi:putative ABC transport system permease protein